MKRTRIVVPGYGMDQEDLDSLASFLSSLPLTEYDNTHIYPIQRDRKTGEKINLN